MRKKKKVASVFFLVFEFQACLRINLIPVLYLYHYLSLLITSPKNFLERYYFHWRVSVYHSINSKSSQPIFMKFGRTVYNDKISIPFEDEMNRFIRTEVIEKMVFRHHELRPFDNLFFSYYFPFFII